jgi:hypothetical protein
MIGVLRYYRSLWPAMAKVAADTLEDSWQIRATLRRYGWQLAGAAA